MAWRRADWLSWAVGLLITVAGAQASAKGGDPGHGKIDWTSKTVTARGSGAPSKKAKSPAAARLGAERAAKMDAYRNILEALKGVQVTAKSSAGDLMSNGQIKAQVQGVIRGAKVVDTVYYSDLSVDVVLRMPIDGALTQALVPTSKQPKPVPSTGNSTGSGLVINAKGLRVQPAIAPRILDEKGDEVYSVSYVTENAVLQNGIIGYATSLDDAKKHQRVAPAPTVMRAIATGKDGKSDIVISNSDADKLRDVNSNVSYLASGKVMVVIDKN